MARSRATVSPATNGSGDGDAKQRILHAALELMAEKGYSGTSISMICQRSGLPPSSTYWHFGSKEGLLTAVVAHSARRWMEGLPRWSNLPGEPRERLFELLDAAADLMAADPTPMRLMLLLSLERRGMSAESAEVIRDVRRSAAGGFRIAFREIYGTSGRAQKMCDEAAAFALATVDGAFLAHQTDPKIDLHRMLRDLGTAFLGLGDQALGISPAPANGRRAVR